MSFYPPFPPRPTHRKVILIPRFYSSCIASTPFLTAAKRAQRCRNIGNPLLLLLYRPHLYSRQMERSPTKRSPLHTTPSKQSFPSKHSTHKSQPHPIDRPLKISTTPKLPKDQTKNQRHETGSYSTNRPPLCVLAINRSAMRLRRARQ